jgi:hypothetical protein
MESGSLERLIALVRRELGAESVRVLDATEAMTPADNVVHAKLPDGRQLAVAFAGAPPARAALVRRLAILTATFAQSLEQGGRTCSRPTPARSLQEELRALAVRARALDAAVIDAHSPVVWGAGSAEHERPPPEKLGLELVPVDVSRAPIPPEAPLSGFSAAANSDGDDDAETPSLERARELTARAIHMVRELPGLAGLRKGGHVAQVVRGGEVVALARSFASIYLLVLAFEGPFDELRAERAVEDSLPRIERLVLALPPLDPKPAPIAGVIALRRGRRR